MTSRDQPRLFEPEPGPFRFPAYVRWYWVTRERPPSRHIHAADRQPVPWLEWHAVRGQDPYKLRQPISHRLRQQVIERDGYVCRLCGLEVEPCDVHLDHIKPVLHGGQADLDNLQVTHSRCNMSKGARLLEAH